jgi:hypothetical protein
MGLVIGSFTCGSIINFKHSENSSDCFLFEVHWCVWYELAKKTGVPEACIPNCYADDVVYPEYLKNQGSGIPAGRP